jgi:hypothetical protein
LNSSFSSPSPFKAVIETGNLKVSLAPICLSNLPFVLISHPVIPSFNPPS